MSKRIMAYLGLGANLGDPINQLQQALALLHHSGGVSVRRISSLYETSPVGYLDQPNFFNLVAEIDTVLPPTELLQAAQKVEQCLHRVRLERFGPRTMDVDILLYDHRIIDTVELTIPHPRLLERAFALIPLHELTGEIILPTGQSLDEAMRALPKDQWIKKRDFSW
ncbi:2-amino-4-hydroxy-6-hydroxymethyldihydropteridine diphosphokinase [Shimazuella sp. AN120528]|uniref:2-amino-4-hydroxy-6- hydroxymethyldihydropteridine diphosphokinase n=1 Tax=Shimazuella soli TaxID=1892854 RepID=UPI001F0F4F7C|nr:2-amino-4-hydroxy-6-hydroxymethyldihydropteridine diphosphokinase [Shimazuella soli]MCH5585881.1 2-amino-4-hydroxy-6-hydroxymethyldihydropteridine diphosphokinase [Shimazuella soli]